MTIATYSDLQSAIASWLGHSLFTANIADFITLFEASANRKLLTRQQETVATLTPDTSGNATLPSDYLAWRRVTWTGSTRTELAYVAPDYFEATYPTRPADTPRFFT